MNTLANHGYISRDGITTWAEAANAIQTVFGFGYDLAAFLSAVGLIAGGDLVTGKYSIGRRVDPLRRFGSDWSVGGADSRVPNTLGYVFPSSVFFVLTLGNPLLNSGPLHGRSDTDSQTFLESTWKADVTLIVHPLASISMDFARLTTQSPVWTPILGMYLGFYLSVSPYFLGHKTLISFCPPAKKLEIRIMIQLTSKYYQ